MTKAQVDRERKILFPDSRLSKFQQRYPAACCPTYFGLWHKPREKCLAEYKHLRMTSAALLRLGALLRNMRIDLLDCDQDLYTDFVHGMGPDELRARVKHVLGQVPDGLFAKRLRDLLNEITSIESIKYVPAAKIKLPAEEYRLLYGDLELYEAQETADEAAQDKELASGKAGGRAMSVLGECKDTEGRSWRPKALEDFGHDFEGTVGLGATYTSLASSPWLSASSAVVLGSVLLWGTR